MEESKFYIIRAHFGSYRLFFIEEDLDDAERHAANLLANGADPVHVIPVKELE